MEILDIEAATKSKNDDDDGVFSRCMSKVRASCMVRRHLQTASFGWMEKKKMDMVYWSYATLADVRVT